MISYWLISNISIHSWLSWGITRFGTDMEGYHQGHPALQFQWRQPGHLGGCQPNASWRGIETTSSMGLRTEKCWGMIFERSVYINIQNIFTTYIIFCFIPEDPQDFFQGGPKLDQSSSLMVNKVDNKSQSKHDGFTQLITQWGSSGHPLGPKCSSLLDTF